MNAAPIAGPHTVLHNGTASGAGAGAGSLVPAPNTSTWYTRHMGCIRWDQTAVASKHSFPDAPIPRGIPLDPGAHAKICLEYRSSAPPSIVSSEATLETEMAHPQFAFRPGGPGTPYQIDVESQLRRLDQPLSKVQAVLPDNAPLYRNTVAPPTPVNVPANVQNAGNPIAVLVKPDGDPCRAAADAVATSMSSRWINNPTRQDTQRFTEPFSPPGIGTASPYKSTAVSLGGQPVYTASAASAAAISGSGSARASLAQVNKSRVHV